MGIAQTLNPMRMFTKSIEIADPDMKLLRERARTISNVMDAVAMLRDILQKETPADELVDKLLDLYAYQPPTDEELARLSLLQQSMTNTGGAEEYATLTIWMCALQSLLDSENGKSYINRMLELFRTKEDTLRSMIYPLHRVQSCPCLQSVSMTPVKLRGISEYHP